jgi:hypothetical protein
MRVKTQEVKQICEILLTDLEQSGCHEIELEQDAYWAVISREDMYANDGSPRLGVGSLNEDKEALEKFWMEPTPYPRTILSGWETSSSLSARNFVNHDSPDHLRSEVSNFSWLKKNLLGLVLSGPLPPLKTEPIIWLVIGSHIFRGSSSWKNFF